MELDIYIPDLKIGIEYDGVYWHHKKQATYEREQRKYNICKEHGIKLFRVREQKKHEGENPPADWSLFLSKDKMDDLEFDQAVKQVIKKVISEANVKGVRVPNIDVNRDRFEILAYKKGPVKNSVQELAPELVNEWDFKKNGELKPNMIAGGSSQSVHWICSKCGYKWEAVINSRNKGAGCPACAGNIVVTDRNDLVTMRSDLAKEWDHSKNENVDPSQVSYSSSRKYWWICPEGHDSYQATPAHRVNGTGCPICGNIRIGEKSSRPVDQLSLDGEHIRTFKSVKDASEYFGLSKGAISNAIRKKSTSGVYKWRHHIK